jgi:hypothetical protein
MCSSLAARGVRSFFPSAAATSTGRRDEDPDMNATATLSTHDSQAIVADGIRPCFLDDLYNADADATAEWWLDLGRVDLPATAW